MSWEGRDPWRDEDGIPPERDYEQRTVTVAYLDELYAKAEELRHLKEHVASLERRSRIAAELLRRGKPEEALGIVERLAPCA